MYAERNAESDEKALVSILQKLPTAIPFLMAKVKTDECKRDLRDFTVNMRETPKELEGTIDGLRTSICKVPTGCVQEVLDAIKQMVSTGGMVEKMVRSFLENKGVDLESVDFLLLGYLESICSSSNSGRIAEEL